MRRVPKPYFSIILGAVLFVGHGSAQTAAADEVLWSALEEGGKVVLMRHAPVERGAGKGDPLVRDSSCERERMLSHQGRQDAQTRGRQFADRGIAIDKVLHSPFCRTAETARLAFGEAFPGEFLSLLEILGADEAARRTQALNQVIGAHAGKGNLILVTHEPNINAVSFETVRHLDVVVLGPSGDGEFEELGVIPFDPPE